MKTKVIEVDSELAVVLPRDVVTSLNLKVGQTIHASALADGGFRIGLNDLAYEKAMRIAEDAMVEYAETFKALAKS